MAVPVAAWHEVLPCRLSGKDMKWDKSAHLILRAAALSHADVQTEDGVDWPFLPALVQRARSSLLQTTVAFSPSWCTGLPTPSAQSYEAPFRCIKMHGCCRWYFRELEPPGLPYQSPALRGAHACWLLRLTGENCPYCFGCFSLGPQIYLSQLGFGHVFQQDHMRALGSTRAGNGVQRCSRPLLSRWARWAAFCLPAWSVCLGDHCSAQIQLLEGNLL